MIGLFLKKVLNENVNRNNKTNLILANVRIFCELPVNLRATAETDVSYPCEKSLDTPRQIV